MTKSRAVPGLRLAGSAKVAWDIGSTGTLVAATTTVAVPLAQVGDIVVATPATPRSGFVYQGYVSAPSVVTLTAINCTTGTVDPDSVIVSVLVIRP